MKITTKKLSELRKPEKNVRIHTEQQLREFERSVKMFGQIRPIVIDENNVILAGNGLYDTLLRLEYEEAEVYQYFDLTENQKKKLMIADNKIFSLGIENLDTLNSFLEDLHDDLDIPGYDSEILKQMVSKQNLELLKQSILTNGWTLPIVVRPDYTIIDGYHRWTVAGQEPLITMLGGMVPVVIVEHSEKSEDMYGTVTHNRARGTHLLEPMKAIVKDLMNEGKSIEEIGKQLGMKPEEIFRLSDFSKEDFLKMMVKGRENYSKAEYITKF